MENKLTALAMLATENDKQNFDNHLIRTLDRKSYLLFIVVAETFIRLSAFSTRILADSADFTQNAAA